MNKFAVFTIQKNEDYQLPRWIKYYSTQIDPKDLYILNHESDSPKTLKTLEWAKKLGINVIPVSCDEVFNHPWLLDQVQTMQGKLLERYEYVIYTDCDELIIPKEKELKDFVNEATKDIYRCKGYEVVEDKMYPSTSFNKSLLASRPVKWVYGYHFAEGEPEVSEDLYLIHLHRLNYKEAWQRNQRWAKHKWNDQAVRGGLSIQNQLKEENRFKAWFYDTEGEYLEDIPKTVKNILDMVK